MDKLDNLVENSLEQLILETEEERALDGKYHPSSMWMCARAAILAARYVEPSAPADAQARRVFRIGHMYHALVQEALQHAGPPELVEFYPEFKIDVPEWNVVGAGDGLLNMDGLWWVLEIKSTKSLKYTPKEEHVKQASVYFTAARDFGFEQFENNENAGKRGPLDDKLKGIILVYLNKADLEIKQYVYPYDKSWRPRIEKRVKELDRYRLELTEELPPALPLDGGKPNWYLGYCPYRGSGSCCADEQEDW